MFLYRQDGELAAYRPLLPSGLPSVATEFLDADVVAGIEYRYRVEVREAGEVSTGESEAVVPGARDDSLVLARPMQWLADVPRGTSATLTVTVDGVFNPFQKTRVSIPEELMPDLTGLSAEVGQPLVSIPGTFQVTVHAKHQIRPGTYPIPVRVQSGKTVQIVWVFVRVSVPFGSETGFAPPYPATSRKVGIHTDSQLREETNNLLVMKGELGDILGNARGTGVVALVDLGNGQIIEQADRVSNDSYYSLSIPLPSLERDTVVRTRVTWMGSSTSPGGTSPILSLPVGGYSMAAEGGGLQQSRDEPEKAFFVMGVPPSGPSQEDVEQIVEHAKTTVLAEFSREERVTLESKTEIESALSGAQDAQTFLFYAVGDMSQGTVQLSGGETITPQELSSMVNSLPDTVNSVVIVEGPRSGAFAASGAGYRSGTTVLTSCSARESTNKFSPWYRSFSGAFFDACRVPLSVADSFSVAGLSFLDFFFGQTQTPLLISGKLSNTKLYGRFVPATLPDLVSPEILGFRAERIEGEAFALDALAADNRDSAENLIVTADVLAMDGSVREGLTFAAADTGNLTHRAFLQQPGIPGFGVILSVRDSSGNMSIPFSTWVATSSSTLAFDINGDGIVDAEDLIQCIAWSVDRTLPSDWQFQLASA
ncbi:MAG TPA: hypothetical protein PKH07_05765, partial [bacterium]|nr:hypothetical protein [bacterium]